MTEISSNSGIEAGERLQSWLNERCGFHFSGGDLDILKQRLDRILDRFGIVDLQELAAEVERGRNDEVIAAVVHAASTNHTYFFREMSTLKYYRDEILSELEPRDEIRIWSAAASSGDEAYTCGIIAMETLGSVNSSGKLKILGTDISGPVIAAAESALYRASAVEHVPVHLRERYFHESADGRFLVKDEIRRLCTFRRMNLMKTPYPFQKKFDVVFCRNVLYYFKQPAQRQVLNAIYEVTQPNGWLVTDVSFSLRDLRVPWVTVSSGIHRKGK